jgi:hypothetical protein
MSNYTKATDFASKDDLLSGDPQKIIKGAEIDDEFAAIQTAVNSKADSNNSALTGTPTAPTASAATNTTQIATTAFVTRQVNLSAFTITEGSGVLYINYNGTPVVQISSAGAITAIDDVTGFGTI